MQKSAEYPRDLVAWTINKRREMKCLKKMGVSAILTDRPARLAKLNRANRPNIFWRKTGGQKRL